MSGGACGSCGSGPVAYARRYSGQRLCAPCFMESIERKAARAISKYGMIGRGDLVCVAVSGGKDSLALLRVLDRMSRDGGRFRIRAATIDEGIPGYRDEALGIVEEYCGRLGVGHDVCSYEELFGTTLEGALEARGGRRVSACAICGTLRRRAIDKAAAGMGADCTATAHNLDDMLQTFLINMMSGDTERIGRADPAAPGAGGARRIKPFCEIYEAEVVYYAFAAGIPFQAEPCPHAGEGVRTELRQFLNRLEESHAGAKNGMYRSAVRIAGAVRESGAGGVAEVAACPRCGSPCSDRRMCAACRTVLELRGPHPNADIATPRNGGR